MYTILHVTSRCWFSTTTKCSHLNDTETMDVCYCSYCLNHHSAKCANLLLCYYYIFSPPSYFLVCHVKPTAVVRLLLLRERVLWEYSSSKRTIVLTFQGLNAQAKIQTITTTKKKKETQFCHHNKPFGSCSCWGC